MFGGLSDVFSTLTQTGGKGSVPMSSGITGVSFSTGGMTINKADNNVILILVALFGVVGLALLKRKRR